MCISAELYAAAAVRILPVGGQPEGTPMDEYSKGEIWDLAAGTFIAVSLVSGMALIIAVAI